MVVRDSRAVSASVQRDIDEDAMYRRLVGCFRGGREGGAEWSSAGDSEEDPLDYDGGWDDGF
jgi:hypothetical protein